MLPDSLDMYMWQMDGTKILNIRGGITYILKVKIGRNIIYIYIYSLDLQNMLI